MISSVTSRLFPPPLFYKHILRQLTTTNIMMASFKKLQVHKLSSNFAEATAVVEAPLVSPAPGQVRIKNHFAGVNATDVNISAGRYFTDGKVPYDIGFEGCGIIDEVGSGVDSLKKGQSVLYLGSGGYSEYLYAQPEQLIPVPEVKPDYLGTVVNGKIF